MAVTPPIGPHRDEPAPLPGPAFDCPRCGRLRVRIDRPGNVVDYVCPACRPDGLPGDLTRLAPR